MINWNAISSFDFELWQLNLKIFGLLLRAILLGIPHIKTFVVAPQHAPGVPHDPFF